jgi:hypothetical protein
MDEKEIESRLSKIEEYIRCCEKTKDQQWKDALNKKLDDICGDIKSETRTQISNSLSETKGLFERSRKRAYASGVYLGGTSMIAVGFANFIAANPRELFSAPMYTIFLGFVLVFTGSQLMSKAKER